MAARPAASAPPAGSSGPPEGFDPRFRELLDHLAVDLAHLFVGVPQPGVQVPAAARSASSKEN